MSKNIRSKYTTKYDRFGTPFSLNDYVVVGIRSAWTNVNYSSVCCAFFNQLLWSATARRANVIFIFVSLEIEFMEEFIKSAFRISLAAGEILMKGSNFWLMVFINCSHGINEIKMTGNIQVYSQRSYKKLENII